MTSALATPPLRLSAAEGGATLQERLEAVLAEAQERGVSQCLVCQGPMAAGEPAARCLRCGSALS